MHLIGNLIAKKAALVQVIDAKQYLRARKRLEKLVDKLWIRPLGKVSTDDPHVARLAFKYGLRVEEHRSLWRLRHYTISIPGPEPLEL